MRAFPITLLTSLALSIAALAPASAQPQGPQQTWQAAWSTSLQAIPDLSDPPPLYKKPDVAGRTIRQVIIPSLDGQAVRVKLSNRYGTQSLVVERAVIARSDGSAGLAAGPTGTLLFGGRPSITLAPGAEADSDALPLTIARGAPLAVSLVLGPRQTMQAWHRIANQVNFISTAGDHAADTSKSAFHDRLTQFVWITQLSVPSAGTGGLTAIGDSITDGLRSTLGAHRSWPEALARRVVAEGLPPMAVNNAGISGNRLLSDSPCFGERIVNRFEHDAVLPGVRAVVLQVGINDINFAAMPPRRGLDCDTPHTQVKADDLIKGYQQVIASAHRHGLRILLGTLTPAALPPEREAIRQEVNRWIRNGAGFDGVIDFDAALRDPRQPAKLQPSYDSGDGIHPNDAGYAAMAQTVPLTRLRDILSHP
jgi:lysophospholipase L1-like esterase